MSKKRTIGEVKLKNPATAMVEALAAASGRYIDGAIRDVLLSGFTKYRKKRVPTWFTIKIPVVEKHYCTDDDGEETGSGFLIGSKEVRLFKIGNPYRRSAGFPQAEIYRENYYF